MKVCFAFILLILLVQRSFPPAYAHDQAATDLAKVFSDVCWKNVANPDSVRAWAKDKGLPEVTNSEGLKVYVGEGPGGNAWFFKIGSMGVVLAVRGGQHACAVYGDAVDPADIGHWFDVMISIMHAPGVDVTEVKNDKTEGLWGVRIGKVYLAKGTSGSSARMFTLITNERAGGPYQATLQLTVLNPG